jgi:hypothetical protein
VRAHRPLIPVAYFRAARVKCCAFTCSHAAFTCSHAGRCSPYFFDLYAFAVNACSPAYDHGFDALARFHVSSNHRYAIDIGRELHMCRRDPHKEAQVAGPLVVRLRE